MKVYYDASIWERQSSHKINEKPGIKQWVNWRFNYLGKEYIIPCIYRFNKGIVMDIIQPLEERAIQEFKEKYKCLDEEELSVFEEEQIERDRPYKQVKLEKIWINEECIDGGWGSTGATYLAGYNEEERLLTVRESYSKHLQDYDSFHFQRIRISYPKIKRDKNRRKHFGRGQRIEHLKFTTRSEYRNTSIGESFTLSKENPRYEMTFVHPITAKKHQLSFKWEESIELSMPKIRKGKVYGELGSYKVIPALEKHESLIFDQSMQFEQVEEHKKGHYSKEGGSIGIIGGASGPTAIFLARKKDTTPIQYCYSKLSDCMQSHTFYLESIRTLETKGQTYIFNI